MPILPIPQAHRAREAARARLLDPGAGLANLLRVGGQIFASEEEQASAEHGAGQASRLAFRAILAQRFPSLKVASRFLRQMC